MNNMILDPWETGTLRKCAHLIPKNYSEAVDNAIETLAIIERAKMRAHCDSTLRTLTMYIISTIALLIGISWWAIVISYLAR